MTPLPIHDPLDAIAETEATGEVASCFTDIRETMAIPIVTSIWRVLAGMDGALPQVWAATRPILQTGAPQAALARLRAESIWPMPPDPPAGLRGELGLEAPLTILDGYDRANGLTLLALGAVVATPSGRAPQADPMEQREWPELPKLRERAAIKPSTWALIEEVNRLGSTPDQPGVATLWRHLADWPELLRAIGLAYGPLEAGGTLRSAIDSTAAWCRGASADMATLRSPAGALPADAATTIERYVTHPGLVVRMVVMGHAVAAWLRRGQTGAR